MKKKLHAQNIYCSENTCINKDKVWFDKHFLHLYEYYKEDRLEF